MEDDLDRSVVALHLVLFSLGAALLVVADLDIQTASWGFVLVYNAAIPAYFGYRGAEIVTSIWTFALSLSIFQVLPDWFLCTELGTLVFPSATGAAPVPTFMAGLWVAPLLLTTYLGERVESASSASGRADGLWAAALAGLAVFGASELLLTSVPVWEPVGVHTFRGMALYILPAEALLCAAALYAYRRTRERSVAARIGAAAIVSWLYLGTACASYLVVDQLFLASFAA